MGYHHKLSSPFSSRRDIPSPPIKLAGLVLRRKEGKECSPHSRLSPPYKQEDYEVLLRRWTKAPYTGQLCMVSGPMVQGSSPDAVLLGEVQGWTAKLAAQAEMKKAKGLKGTSCRDHFHAAGCMHTHAHTCTHMYTHVHTCIHMHTHAYTCIHMHTHAYTCTHMHTHAHTCTHMLAHPHPHEKHSLCSTAVFTYSPVLQTHKELTLIVYTSILVYLQDRGQSS